MTTGALWHEKYMWWDTRHAGVFIPASGWIEPDEHAENPRTKRRLKNLLDATGLSEQLQWIRPRAASTEELCRVHDRSYLDRMKELSDANGGDAGELTPFGPGGTRSRRSPPGARSRRPRRSATGSSTTPVRSSARPATTPSGTRAAGSAW